MFASAWSSKTRLFHSPCCKKKQARPLLIWPTAGPTLPIFLTASEWRRNCSPAFVNVRGEELSGIQNIDTICQFGILEEKHRSGHAVAEADDERLQSGAEIVGALSDKGLAWVRRHMDGDRLDLKVALAVRRVIRHRMTVVFELPHPKDQIEFCPDEMLEHGPDVIRATRVRLNFAGLLEKILDIRAERFAGVEMECDLFLGAPALLNQSSVVCGEEAAFDPMAAKNTICDDCHFLKATKCIYGCFFFKGKRVSSVHLRWVNLGSHTVVSQETWTVTRSFFVNCRLLDKGS